MSRFGEKQTAITGIGMSAVSRTSSASGLELTVDASLAAIAAAGLSPDDIDGVATYPGAVWDRSGMSPTGIPELRLALGLKPDWFCANKELAGQLGCVFSAVAAVSAGFANHVLVFRTICEASARRASPGAIAHGAGAQRIVGVHEWTAPFGAVSGAPFFAMHAQRHFHDYGTTSEHLGYIALNARANAARNPAAIYRTPLTMDDYFQSRMIASPLRLLDCDVPVDGSVAVIVSRLDEAKDLRRRPLRIEAIGSRLHARDSWFRSQDLTQTGAVDAARMMWERTNLKPADIDVAQLYDGFSIHTLLWLEALGFCARGEGGDFLDKGRRIALDGELPVNTGGGQLSAGRLHGLGHLHEACLQLWGEGGERQVAEPRTALVTAGYGGGFNGSMILVRE